ncbi:gliding motility-associated C-terminal domain-containing protein [Capnocytophaga cynodegmi]|uniref:gliding motility-associated C-terminal domain-containing protein n=1 Tax=Capnocytophaga cynodegmi TaxID=28189 RepID=UPI00385CA9BC
MLRQNRHITPIFLWVLSLLTCCFVSTISAQSKIVVGQTSTFSVGDVPQSTYTWELYVPTSNLNFAKTAGNCPPSKAIFLNGNTGNQVQVQWLEAGKYYYKVQISDGCSSNFKIGTIEVVEVVPPPKINIKYNCDSATALLEASDYTGTLLWNTGETTSSIVVDTKDIPKGNTVSYWVQQTVNGIQSELTTVHIERNLPANQPDVSAFPVRIYLGQSVSITSIQCGDDTVRWFADAALTQEINQSEITPSNSTTFYAVCQTEKGCQSQAVSLLVEVVSDNSCEEDFKNMFIPNALSLNDDGANDVWQLEDLKKYCEKCNKKNVVTIFNRWGVKVYEKENYMLDGERFNGFSEHKRTVSKEVLPNGTYFYVITFDDGKQKTGYIYIRSGTL